MLSAIRYQRKCGNLLIVDEHARIAQQGRDLAVAVADVLMRKRDDIGYQSLFILTVLRHHSLRLTMLPEHRRSTNLADRQRPTNVLNAEAAPRRG